MHQRNMSDPLFLVAISRSNKIIKNMTVASKKLKDIFFFSISKFPPFY